MATVSGRPLGAKRRHRTLGKKAAAAGLARPSAPANAAGIPTAPAHAGETLQVGSARPFGSPLMGSDAALGFRDLSFQVGYGFLAGRTGDPANGKLGSFQGFRGVTVLLELNPVPSDVAIAINIHVVAAHGGRLVLSHRMVKDERPWLTIG